MTPFVLVQFPPHPAASISSSTTLTFPTLPTPLLLPSFLLLPCRLVPNCWKPYLLTDVSLIFPLSNSTVFYPRTSCTSSVPYSSTLLLPFSCFSSLSSLSFAICFCPFSFLLLYLSFILTYTILHKCTPSNFHPSFLLHLSSLFLAWWSLRHLLWPISLILRPHISIRCC